MRERMSVLVLALVAIVAAANSASPRARESRPEKPKQSMFLVSCTVRPLILFLRKAPSNCCCPADSVGEWGGRPRIMLVLSNKSARSLWLAVRLTPPSMYPACEHRDLIAPKEKTGMLFTQDSILAGEYAVNMMAFADSEFADTVESISWRVRPK